MSDNFDWWWLSHADENGFLGVVIIPAPDFMAANQIKHICGLNPGGEVSGHYIPKECHQYITLAETMTILKKERAQELMEKIDAPLN